jgi:S1-C subfamily serine protease
MHRVVSIPNPSASSKQLELSDIVQTSARVNAGTSGGPLLNVQGQVIAVAMSPQPASGISGFGLNVADIQDVVQQILQNGQVVVSSLGAATTELNPELAALYNLPAGSQIVTIEKDGPAAAAGLQPGDVITQLDDVKVDAAHPLSLVLRSRFRPSQRVAVTYTRAKTSTQAQLTLGGQHPTCT